jgi:hypothetical protein
MEKYALEGICFGRHVAFAFDPERTAMMLAAGDKSGQSEKAFYRRLIAIADKRFDAHIERLKGNRTKTPKVRK